MTLQDDLARHWFQPLDPPGAPQNRARPKSGPMTTRFAGELRLDEPQIAVPRTPQAAEQPMPARVEVTQPYIPAIRDTPPEFAQPRPEFAKRLNTEPPAPPAPQPAAPASRPPEPEPDTPAPAAPKRRSLMRRVVRTIIGPDLLRKDPPRRR